MRFATSSSRGTRIGALVASVFVFAAVELISTNVCAQAADSSSPDPIGNIFKGIGNFLSNITSPKGQKLNELVDNKQFKEAAEYYVSERSYFDAERSRYLPLLRTIADGINSVRVPDLQLQIEVLRRLGDRFDDSGNDWSQVREALSYADRALNSYNEIEFLKDERFRAPELRQLADAQTRLRALYESSATQAFRSFNQLSEISFFDTYPVNSNAALVLHDAFDAVLNALANQPAPAVEGYRGRYANMLAEPELAKLGSLYVDRLLAERATGQVGFFEKLDAVRKATSIGFKVGSINGFKTAVILVLPENAEKEIQVSKIAADTSTVLKSLKPADIAADSEVSAANYLVLVQAGTVDVQRKVAEKRDENSKFQSGTRSVPNPQFAAAQAKFIQAQSEYNNTRLQNAVTPTYGMAAGILRGVGEGILAGAVTNARNELGQTPPTLTEPIYQDYQFKVTRIDVTRSAIDRIWIVDRQLNSVAQKEIANSESKSFQLAYNLRDQDPDIYRYRSQYEDDKVVDAYEKSDFSVKFSWLVDQVVAAPPGFRLMESEASLIAEAATLSQRNIPTAAVIKSQSNVPDDSRFESIVVIRNPKGSLGTGFFITPDQILTNYHVIEGAQIAEIQLRNGQNVVGRVTKTDIGLDLAIVKVNEIGKPVQFYGSTLSTGATVEVIGHPQGLEFSVTRGIVSAIRKIKNPLIRGSREMLIIQTDAAISPGNSGGPLYLGSQVIGVNSQKLVRTGVEGLGFAIHFAEVQRFIQEP